MSWVGRKEKEVQTEDGAVEALETTGWEGLRREREQKKRTGVGWARAVSEEGRHPGGGREMRGCRCQCPYRCACMPGQRCHWTTSCRNFCSWKVLPRGAGGAGGEGTWGAELAGDSRVRLKCEILVAVG